MRHPQTYLVNTAVHAAIDRIRQDTRLLSESEVSEFFELEDRTPGPAEIAQSRSGHGRHVQGPGHADAAPADILVAARVDGLSRPELAQRWGISLRLVGRELQTAHEHCLRAMRRAQDVATPGQPPVEPGRRGQERRNNASKCVFRAFGVPFAVAQTSKQENGASARAARTRP